MRRVRKDDATLVKIASTRNELQAAFRLVYHAYVQGGLAEPNRYRMRVTPYHLLPTTDVFIAVSQGKVIGTLTLVGDGPMGLPMETIYGREVVGRRIEGAVVSEVSCLADRAGGLVRGLPVLVKVMSLMAQRAKYRGIDELLIAVHPRHAPFYERFIGFEIIGQERAYEAVGNKPAVGLSLDLNRLPVIHPRAYKRFFGTPFPEKDLQYRPVSREFRTQLRRIVEATYVCEAGAEIGACLCEVDRLCA